MHHLYAVMQVSMSEHVNHILASHTLSPTASSPASFEFLISDPLHSYNCKVFSSRSYFTFSPSPKIFFSCSFSFYFPDFSKVHIYYTCRLSYNLLTRHVAWRYFDTPSLSFFSLFRFLRFFVNEVHTRVTLYVAFSAFLSTENDLHHNLRPNIGGHTSRHNNRVPSKNLNGRGGWFLGEKDGYGGRTRGV